MAGMGAGSSLTCVLGMFKRWGNDEHRRLALYYSGKSSVYAWFACGSDLEANWIMGHNRCLKIFEGSRSEFAVAVVASMVREWERENGDAL